MNTENRALKFRVWAFLTKEFVDFDIYEGASLGIAWECYLFEIVWNKKI